MPFTKLDSNFASSSIFKLGLDVVGFWAYLMSEADSQGRVTATIPDMAARCRVNEQRIVALLDILQLPDEWSRTPDNDGRRVRVEREPEWAVVLLNHGKYRAKDNTQAERAKRYRDRHGSSRRDGVTVCDASASASLSVVVPLEGGRGGDPRPEHERVLGSNFREASDLDVKILRAARRISESTGLPAWQVMRKVTSYKRRDGEMSAGVEDPSRLGSILARQKALEDATWWLEELEKGATDGKAG